MGRNVAESQNGAAASARKRATREVIVLRLLRAVAREWARGDLPFEIVSLYERAAIWEGASIHLTAEIIERAERAAAR